MNKYSSFSITKMVYRNKFNTGSETTLPYDTLMSEINEHANKWADIQF